MFIQVIEGRTSDPEALDARFDDWQRTLAPGAIGYLGSTSGVTPTGDAIVIARFRDADAAKANSERPEQTAWWAETEKLFEGPVRFHDTSDVTDMDHGDRNRAGFVQVMEGHVSDLQRAHSLESDADPILAELRPDLLGTVTAFFDDGEFTEVAYFTTEADARRGEALPVPTQAESMMAEFQQVMQVDRYLDLSHPHLMSA